MKKKNGFNIMLFVFIISLIMILSCAENDKKNLHGILVKTDSEFSAMSVREGMQKAFLSYIADSGVMLRNNAYPLRSRNDLIGQFKNSSDTGFILRWEPVYEKLSRKGDLGYTFGVYTRTIKSTGEVARGTYVTIWEKQKDGTWKFVLDTGTQGLPDKQD